MPTIWVRNAATAIVVLVSLSSTGRTADTCAQAMAKVNSIETFTNCLNACLGGAGKVDVSNAVQCLPAKCSVVVTMSPQSAQRACTLGSCQLPRIIFDCPGSGPDLRFRPSFLMCPVDSQDPDGNFGVNRIEIGQDNMKLPGPFANLPKDAFATRTLEMLMADVPIPPAQNWQNKMLGDVLSQSTRNNNGTKACNKCHTPNGSLAIKDMMGNALMAQKSLDIDAFSAFAEGLAQYVIGADAPIDRMRISSPLSAKGSDGNVLQPLNVVKDGLTPICDCINNANNQKAIIADNNNKKNFPKDQSGRGLGDGTPNPNIQMQLAIMSSLCSKLNAYIKPPQPQPGAPGACGTTPGTSCGGLAGGGKYLTGTAVSVLSLQIQGEVANNSSSSFLFTDIDSRITAFNYLTETEIDQIYLSSAMGTRTPGAIMLIAFGTASVNGVTTNINLLATEASGVNTFQISDAATGAILAGGTGETGLASLIYVTSGP